MQNLTDYSPDDKPWDVHKLVATKVAILHCQLGNLAQAERIRQCADLLTFKWEVHPETGEKRLKLESAQFCRVRTCPICQWRRRLMWLARIFKKVPLILADYPNYKFVFLTLTVKNCPLDQLRETLKDMNQAWAKMTKRKAFPAKGWLKSIEVTLGKDGLIHPHFHILMLFKPSYFQGTQYITKQGWVELWQKSLKVDYQPVIDIRAVRPKPPKAKTTRKLGEYVMEEPDIKGALLETFKYCFKEDDLLNKDFLEAVSRELHNTRAVAIGGVFKQYLSEEEPDNLVAENEVEEVNRIDTLLFGWRPKLRHYTKVDR